MSEQENLEISKQSCRDIVNCLAREARIKVLFETDNDTIFLCQNLYVTIDIDIKWCRIHSKQWVLRAAIDIAEYWTFPAICSRVILDRLAYLNSQ